MSDEQNIIQNLARALEDTTYDLMQMVTDGEQQEKVKQRVEQNLLVLEETFEEFMEIMKRCRQ